MPPTPPYDEESDQDEFEGSSEPPLTKEIDDLAQRKIVDYNSVFVATLIQQANALATKDRSTKISLNHVEEAWVLVRKSKPAGWKYTLGQFLTIIGSGLFGVGATGFMAEYTSPVAVRKELLLIYSLIVIVGIIGLVIGVLMTRP